MNSNRFGRGLLFALLAVRLCWAQAAPTQVPQPICVHAALRLDVAQALAISASQSVRPTAGDPGSTGGVPSGVQFGPGPDGTGGIPDRLGGDVDGAGSLPKSPVKLSPAPTTSPQLPCAGAPVLLAAGPGGAGGLPRQQVKTIADPGGGGVIPKSVAAPSRPFDASAADGVGSLPQLPPPPTAPH